MLQTMMMLMLLTISASDEDYKAPPTIKIPTSAPRSINVESGKIKHKGVDREIGKGVFLPGELSEVVRAIVIEHYYAERDCQVVIDGQKNFYEGMLAGKEAIDAAQREGEKIESNLDKWSWRHAALWGGAGLAIGIVVGVFVAR